MAIPVYFASLTLINMQITLHSTDFAGDKNVSFDFLDACLSDPLFYFDYQSFLASLQNFHSNVLQKERYKKLCNYKIKSGNML